MASKSASLRAIQLESILASHCQCIYLHFYFFGMVYDALRLKYRCLTHSNVHFLLLLSLPLCPAVPRLSFNLPSSKAQGCNVYFLENHYKPCHFGIHLIALAEYSQISIHVPGFQSFFILHHFVLAKLATSNIWVK